eukprot:COSAG01_NODE_20_length_38868_cov_34.606071_21_plen_68_part_00
MNMPARMMTMMGSRFSWRGTPGRDVPAAGRCHGKGMIRTEAVTELLLRVYSFHLRFFKRHDKNRSSD